MADLSATFRKPFGEQVAAFRLRLGDLVDTARWDDLRGAQHDRAFMVAGATGADLLADLAAAVDRGIAEGATLADFRRDFRAIVERHGWHGWTGEGSAKGEAWRTRVIWETNMRTSYAAGRMAQLVEGNFAYWIYRHGGSREPRPQHLAWDGLTLPPDHPFWTTHAPPNGWGCSCYVTGARSRRIARRLGGDPDRTLPEGWDRPDPRTGAPPGIDRGWAHAPGASVAREVAQTVTALSGKMPRLPATIGAALWHGWPATALGAVQAEFRSFVDRALSGFVRKDFMIVGALKPGWITAAAAQGIRIESAEIAVQDVNVQHTFRGTGLVTAGTTRRETRRQPKVEALDIGWYRDLPAHLLAPTAVLVDRTGREPVFLLVYDMPGRAVKLVVEINTPVKKAGRPLNTVQSGRLVTADDLRADVNRGVMVIEGDL